MASAGTVLLPTLRPARTATRNPVTRSAPSNMRRSVFGSLKDKLQGSSSKSDNPSPFPVPSPTRRPDRPGMNAFTTPSNGPPPAYSPSDPIAPVNQILPSSPVTNVVASNHQGPVAAGAGDDDRYAFLSSFDTLFLIDDSGSMAGRYWREVGQCLEAITPVCVEHDKDGIEIAFLNAPRSFDNVTSQGAVNEIFSTVRPRGMTPTGQRLSKILREYLSRYEAHPTTTKPLNIIVITDGEPSDDVESPIIAAAKRLDQLMAEPWQVGIQFFQVGEDPAAQEHLQTLDDELSRMGDGCRDIVDTVPFARGQDLNAESILKVVLGAVNKRLDRRRNRV